MKKLVVSSCLLLGAGLAAVPVVAAGQNNGSLHAQGSAASDDEELDDSSAPPLKLSLTGEKPSEPTPPPGSTAIPQNIPTDQNPALIGAPNEASSAGANAADPSGQLPSLPNFADPSYGQALGAGYATPNAPPDYERLLADLIRAEKATEQALAALAQEAEVARQRTIARGRAYVRKSRAGLLPVAGGFEELVTHASQLERLRRALHRDIANEKGLVRKRTQLSKQLSELRTRRVPIELQARATSSQRAALMAQQDRAQAFQQAFSGQGGGGFWEHTAIYGADPTSPGSGPSIEAAAFGAMKGRLPFPLPGRAEIRKAYRGGNGPGLEMSAPKGSPVRAIYKGRVAFADAYTDYGRTVIIEHGGNYYSVSAGLEEIEVKVGDDIRSGDRLGTVGESSNGPALYLELRLGTETLDPHEWFGV